MKTLPKDVLRKIKFDFAHHEIEVMNLFLEFLEPDKYLENDRIVRCIIYLAKKDFGKLKYYVECAKTDPRDIMLWAEYDINDNKLRDFNRLFDN
jgi:galactose-1-phosphate uridylyltransferase